KATGSNPVGCANFSTCAAFDRSCLVGRVLEMAKILCVLYDDPMDGMPQSYARDGIPKLDRYPDGQTLPTPQGIDFTPGELLGCVSGELGLRPYLERNGHTL